MLLDVARGLAALAVAAGHLRAFLFEDAGPNMSLVWVFFYGLTSLGHQAVMVFFVLSGYLVGGSALSADKKNKWSLKDYALKRTSRLLIVLLPALLLTLLLDSIGRDLFHGTLYDGNQIIKYHSTPSPIDAKTAYGVEAFVGNLAFLQTIFVPPFGTNGPLWSLANEFWYYVLFPMIYFGAFPRRGLISRLWLCPAFLILFLLPISISTYMSIWLLGVVAHVPRHAPAKGAEIAIAIVLMASGMAISKIFPGFWGDFACGAAFAFLLWTTSRSRIVMRTQMETFAAWVASISYSLYATHFPIMALSAVAFLNETRSRPSAYLLVVYLALLACVLTACSVFWWVFERHTSRFQKALIGPRPNMP